MVEGATIRALTDAVVAVYGERARSLAVVEILGDPVRDHLVVTIVGIPTGRSGVAGEPV